MTNALGYDSVQHNSKAMTPASLTDYTKTSNPHSLFKAAAFKPLPEWANQAGIPKEAELEKLNKKAFADQKNRLFPLHTKVAAFMSALDALFDPTHVSDESMGRIKKACDYFGVTALIPPYAEHFAALWDKAASESIPEAPTHALRLDLSGDRTVHALPTNTAVEVRKSASSLLRLGESPKLPHGSFILACRNLVKSAMHHGCMNNLPDLIVRIGVPRDVDWDKAASYLPIARTKLGLSEAQLKPYQDALVEGKDGSKSAAEVCKTILELDKTAGACYTYQDFVRGVVTPEEIVFSGMSERDKQAAMSASVLIGKAEIPRYALANVTTTQRRVGLSKAAHMALNNAERTSDPVKATMIFDALSPEDQRNLVEIIVDAN